jgi:hypothetical protein
MATKKNPGRPSKAPGSVPKAPSKTAFVKSLPPSMSGADVVKKAKEAGIEISLAYVYGIRSRTTPKRGAKAATPSLPAKRGPGRPRKAAASTGGGLEAAIEAIVERKVKEILTKQLGALFQ